MSDNFSKSNAFTAFFIATLSSVFFSLVASVFDTTDNVVFWVVQATYALLLCGGAVVYAVLCNKTPSAFKLNNPPVLSHTLLALAMIFALVNGMVFVNEQFCVLIESLGFDKPSVNVPTDNVVVLVLLAGVLPAVCEEVVFRGVIGNGLTSQGKVSGIIISGALFALFHVNPAQTLHQFVLGCLLTVLVMRSGSLWTAIIAHLFNNVCAVVLALTVEPLGVYETYGGVISIVSLAIFAILAVVYAKCTHSKFVACDVQPATDTSKVCFVVAVVIMSVLWVASLWQ